MDIWWTLHLKRDPASVPLARRILLGAMATAGVDPQIAHDLGVALSEACANAVEHGTGDGPDEGYQVTASISGDLLRIEVTDSGPGLPAPAPGGHASRRPSPVQAPPARPAPRRRSRRGRATVPGPLLTAHRPRRDGRPYDTHVLPGGCPDADPMPTLRPVDLDMLPELTAESGRGLFLIHALTDHVRLRNHPLRGAIVSFDKILKWQDDALLRAAS
ncbi:MULTISPECIES: ATP-binding protein [unclassified Streptomyces]|uniref:ATP-binding protein n=1 Tax=Streptomycetaceae TaxID=2062 RepID=UPI002E777F65|nr:MULTISPECIES: ATP-binding protein [unclassified Streptomyces]MED7950684.1 ATP-binding protein [Streptomyces sp. BE303]MEE1828165.1 ATP-binding protein [Streptomyces sp. BE20]